MTPGGPCPRCGSSDRFHGPNPECTGFELEVPRETAREVLRLHLYGRAPIAIAKVVRVRVVDVVEVLRASCPSHIHGREISSEAR